MSHRNGWGGTSACVRLVNVARSPCASIGEQPCDLVVENLIVYPQHWGSSLRRETPSGMEDRRHTPLSTAGRSSVWMVAAVDEMWTTRQGRSARNDLDPQGCGHVPVQAHDELGQAEFFDRFVERDVATVDVDTELGFDGGCHVGRGDRSE
jgi:hypothetical protein